VVPEADGYLFLDRAVYVLDMQRLAGIPREKWLDVALWAQMRAALQGRRVFVSDGGGLAVCVARQPGTHVKRLPNVIHLTPEEIPPKAYHVKLGYTKRGPVILDLAGAHRAILTGGWSGAGKTNFMQSVIIQLCKKHGPAEFQVAIVDTKEVDFGETFARLPNLFAPIAHTVEDGARLIAKVEGERERRQALMASAGVADWRRLDEPFPLLLLVIDEAVDFSKHAGMDVTIKIARKGRAFGVSLLLGTQLPSASAISPQIKANMTCAVAFQCRTYQESMAIIGSSGAQDLDRPGLALAFLDGRWQRIQTLRVGDDGGDLADTVSVPVTPALEPVEVELVRYALSDLGGCFTIGRLAEQFAGQISKRALTKLGQRWELRGWLTAPTNAVDPRRVTDELAALGLPPGQGTVSGDTVIGVTGGDRALKSVIGTGDRASEVVTGPVTGAMRAGVGFPVPTFS